MSTIYVLIITMAMMNGFNAGAGHGGVAMQEFTSYEKCVVAGETWKKDVMKSTGLKYRMGGHLMYTCVEK